MRKKLYIKSCEIEKNQEICHRFLIMNRDTNQEDYLLTVRIFLMKYSKQKYFYYFEELFLKRPKQ